MASDNWFQGARGFRQGLDGDAVYAKFLHLKAILAL
jgi:hypothetical protein